MTDAISVFDPPLSDKEVAQMLGLTRNTLKHWRWVGKSPRYVKLGNKVAWM